LGIDGFGAGASIGLVVTDLKAASAAARGSVALRFLSTIINVLSSGQIPDILPVAGDRGSTTTLVGVTAISIP
jgi:hypothetical protein